MSEFRYIELGDSDDVARLIALSDEILLTNPIVRSEFDYDDRVSTLDQNKLGVSGLCMESSDAVTRAARALRIVAARELLVGWHSITYFGPLNQLPSEDDIVMCRTWGQYDKALYASDHPMAQRPYFGSRRQLAELLPDSQGRFDPEAVTFRQVVVCEPEPSHLRRRAWLGTTPEELVHAGFVMGQSELPVPTADSSWV
jgi:hypothetical protein